MFKPIPEKSSGASLQVFTCQKRACAHAVRDKTRTVSSTQGWPVISYFLTLSEGFSNHLQKVQKYCGKCSASRWWLFFTNPRHAISFKISRLYSPKCVGLFQIQRFECHLNVRLNVMFTTAAEIYQFVIMAGKVCSKVVGSGER